MTLALGQRSRTHSQFFQEQHLAAKTTYHNKGLKASIAAHKFCSSRFIYVSTVECAWSDSTLVFYNQTQPKSQSRDTGHGWLPGVNLKTYCKMRIETANSADMMLALNI